MPRHCPTLLPLLVLSCLFGTTSQAVAQTRRPLQPVAAPGSQQPATPDKASLAQPNPARPAASSPPPATANPDQAPTSEADEIAAALAAIRGDESLAPELRNRCQEVLLDAQKSIERRETAKQATRQLQAAAETADARKTAAERSAEEGVKIDTGGVTASSSATDISAVVKRLNADLASLNEQSKAIQQQINERRTESKELPQRLAALEEELTAIGQPPSDDDETNPVLARVMDQAAPLKKAAIEAELELARQKLTTYEVEALVLPLEQQRLERQIDAVTKMITRVSQWATQQRTDEISKKVADFKQLCQRSQSTDVDLLEDTVLLFEKWPTYVTDAQQWNALLLKAKDATNDLRNDLQQTESLLEADRTTGSGLSRSAGSLLKRKQVMLGRTQALFPEANKQIAAVDDAQDILADIDTLLDELAQQSNAMPGGTETDVQDRQRTLLELMYTDIDRALVDTLIPIGVQFEVLNRLIHDYESVINRNLLWIRSDKPLRLSDLRSLVTVTGWLEADRLRSLAESFIGGVAKRPILAAAMLFLIILFAVLHRWFVLRIVALGTSLNGANAMRLWPTVQAVFFTACAGLPVWLPIETLSRLLGEIATAGTTEAFVADALSAAGLVFLPLEMLRQLIRPHGVAVDHFGWSKLVIQPLGRAVRRTAGLGLGLVFLARLLLLERTVHSELSPLARLVFAGLMLFIAGILWRLLDRRTGVTAGLLASYPDSPLAKLAWLWRPLATALPILLAVLSLAGYAFAATQLAVSLYQSIWLIVAAAVLHSVALRWLLVSKRRIALQQLRERSALREHAEGSGAATEMLDVNQMKLSAIDQQTRRLIDAGILVGLVVSLFWLWSPVVPALSFLDSVVLWQQLAADGTVSSVVTLNNLLIAVPSILFTYVLVRNAPGLLEAAVLQRLPLDNAARYAVTSLTSYVLAILGILFVAGTLGLSWSSVQWLAAGLSVGLGFGLQEVVANFVCGLILLFEQPIRVGDVVTLDSITGVVSRIRMRATTVTTWERQEYVIPNKDLITGRVTNWTLTDSVNRAEITVGVAYGTDTRRTAALLQEICRDIKEIMLDPAPIITFSEFGDSTLNFVVRFYLASLDNRLATISELHTVIHERFHAEGIEIAFPQLDVHVSQTPPASS